MPDSTVPDSGVPDSGAPDSGAPDSGAPPEHAPSPRELDDLELLTHGALGDLRGFEGPEGAVRLVVPADVAVRAEQQGSLELVDPEGVPVARVAVAGTYDDAGGFGVVGEVTAVGHREFGAFRRFHLSPTQVAQRYGERTVTVPVTGPLSEDDLRKIRREAADRPVVLLALTGHGTPQGLSGPGLVRAAVAAASLLAEATVVAVPLASHHDVAGDAALRARVLAAYAPGHVVEVAGEGPLPDAVADVVAFERPGPVERGLVVFFTGLSGSGKSTLARALHDLVLEAGRRTVTSLDGDVVRRHLSAGLTFSPQDRETNIARIGWVAAEVSRHGGVAVCSPIAPFESTRRQVRAMVEDAGGGFTLVHVATPLAECERRDRKGLYARARAGQIPEFTGISSPYEEPTDAEVRVDTTGRTVEDALADVLAALPPGVVEPPGPTPPAARPRHRGTAR